LDDCRSIPEDQQNLLPTNLPPNFRIEKFVPQRTVLAHKNVVLFISHTGASSAQEGLYYSKPIICIPFFADQPELCNRVENSGAGIRLSKEFNASQLGDSVHRIMYAPQFRQMAEKMSKILRCGGAPKFADLVFDRIEIGVEHLKSPKESLSFFQQREWDLLLVKVSLIFCAYFIITFVLRKLKRFLLRKHKLE
jgi:glucuronosyltransferase